MPKLLLIIGHLFLFSGIAFTQQQDAVGSEEQDVVKKSAAGDNCTMWFDGDYKDCCRQHDSDYLKGGDDWRMRLRADNRLFMCVAGKKGVWHLALAPLMWTGVRIFGSDLSPLSRKNIIHKLFKRTFPLFRRHH